MSVKKSHKNPSAEEVIQKYLEAPKGSMTERLMVGIIKRKYPNTKLPKKS